MIARREVDLAAVAHVPHGELVAADERLPLPRVGRRGRHELWERLGGQEFHDLLGAVHGGLDALENNALRVLLDELGDLVGGGDEPVLGHGHAVLIAVCAEARAVVEQ